MAPEWGFPALFFGVQSLIDRHTVETVRNLAGRVAADRGLDLVDVEVSAGRRGGHLRVYVDREGGVGVDELQGVSQELSAVLDANDPIEGAYRLEVSSPGIDRPMRSLSELKRALGRRVRAVRKSEGAAEVVGQVLALEGGLLRLSLEGRDPSAATCEIPLEELDYACFVVDFGGHAAKERRKREAHG